MTCLGRDTHEDVRERTISALMSRYHVDKQQANRIMKHARCCFHQVAESWESE